MTTMADPCKVCKTTPERHEKLELVGDIHHSFSHHGEVNPSTAQARKQARETVNIGPADTVLRALLIDMGLFTMEDLARKELELRERPSRTRPRVDG